MKALKILILFVVVLSGCSQKYVGLSEEDLADRGVLASWKELDADIAKRYEEEIFLNVQIKDFVKVGDSAKLKEIYKSEFQLKDDYARNIRVGNYSMLGGCAAAGGGCIAGFLNYLFYFDPSDDVNSYFESATYLLAGLIGASCFFANGVLHLVKPYKAAPYYVKDGVICTNSAPLMNEQVKIINKSTDFQKIYYTDEGGDIEFEISKILFEPTEKDTIIELIIQYEEMVDAVDVKIKF
ncbi:hypothetical protein JW879_09955 [candidate division WOR-3 bacterium]|nr:hypothetical protein [candidate division WOR-3 bacterium]